MSALARFACLTLSAAAAACSPGAAEPQGSGSAQTVSLRHLTETSVAAPARDHYTIHGDLIPTPSHPDASFYLLRQRQPMLTGTIVAILREERAGKIAYARVEVDCAKRLFHVLGVGNRRSFAELAIAQDGPLRPIEGLPLRQELSSFVCQKNGTPLAIA